MNCSIIYYSARKTSFCEKALKKSFSESGLKLLSAAFAVKADTLGSELMKAFDLCDTVFIVGGLTFSDNRNTLKIISQAASDSEITLLRKIKNDSGDDGCLIQSGKQLLVMLPDEPEQIEAMMRGVLSDYIKSTLL